MATPVNAKQIPAAGAGECHRTGTAAETHRQPGFAPTRWTLVERAQGDTEEGRTALAELCGAYWEPVFQALRRQGHPEESARERAQEFFAWVLAGGRLDGAEPGRGRFRSYLLGALRHFLSDQRESAGRLKRGGGRPDESLEDRFESGIADPAADKNPDARFDRDWALAVMRRGLESVENDYAAGGKQRQFTALKPWLAGGETASQAALAAQLHLTEGAVKVAIHRLRHRFREAIRREISQTLRAGDNIDEELSYLVDVLVRETAAGPGAAGGAGL